MNVDIPTIVTGLIALTIVIDVAAMAYGNRPIPDIIKEFGFMVFGFYFGRGGRSLGSGDKGNISGS